MLVLINQSNISSEKLAEQLLSKVFVSLNSLNVEYCVMNNYENMPEIIPTDVDIAIDREMFDMIDSFLYKFSQENNIEIIQKIWHGYNKCAYILSPLLINERFRIQLDFFVDFSAKGYPNLILNEVMLYGKRPFKMFYVPAPAVEAPFLFMRRIIKNDLKTSHINKLKLLITQEYNNIQQKFIEIFGQELTISIIQLIQTGNEAIFHNNLENFRKALKKFSKRKTNFTYITKYRINNALRLINRLLHPVGFSVVQLGPDGSGKTTIASLVTERVSGSFHGCNIQYWRPYLLPAMGKLKFWNPSEEPKTNPNPHGHSKQNSIKSLFRFFYYLIDYIIGYPFKVYIPKVRKKIIIFDRYYYDYLVDLHRYRFNIPKWLPKLFLPFIPSTDLVIYLDAEPEVLIKRKQELDLSELKRQVNELRKIVPNLPNSHTIKTDRQIEDIIKEISFLILEKKSIQTKKILRNTNRENLERN